MITGANRTETAARIQHAFDRQQVHLEEPCDPTRTLHIDSKMLDMAEAAEEPIADVSSGHGTDEDRRHKPTGNQQAEMLRVHVGVPRLHVGEFGLPTSVLRLQLQKT